MKYYPYIKKNFLTAVCSSLVLMFLAACSNTIAPNTSPPSLKPQEYLKQENYTKRPKNPIEDNLKIYHLNCLQACPIGSNASNIFVDHEILTLSSNTKTKFADWVAYKVSPLYLNGPQRSRNWSKDPKIDEKFTFIPQDYKGMSQAPYFFDRGHQAPLASFKGHEKWYVVNYLSNITPQKKFLNQGAWNKLEGMERNISKKYGEVFVLTGPYYQDDKIVEGPPNDRISYVIPSGYWKIISIKNENSIKSIGFIFSQDTPMNADYCNHVSKISDIEKITKLKFFSNQNRVQENSLLYEMGCRN